MQHEKTAEPGAVSKPSIQRIARLMIAAVLVLGAGNAFAEVFFKWTDDDGVTHFTAQPPSDRDFERVETNHLSWRPPPRPSVDEQVEAGMDSGNPDDLQMPREAEPDPEMMERRCEQARQNLFELNNRRRVILDREDGGQQLLTVEQRQEQIDANQAIIDEWCQG